MRAAAVVALFCLAACGGKSEHAEPAELPPCYELEWSPEWCDGRSVRQVVIICEGRTDRGTLGMDGVWSGAPRPACAPAEKSSRADAWCCW